MSSSRRKTEPESKSRRAKLFKNGRSQAVRIPREFAFKTSEVVMRKKGDALVIEPVRRQNLADVIKSWVKRGPLPARDRFPEIDDPPPEPIDW